MTSTVKKSLLQEESEPKKTEDLYGAPVVQSPQYVVPKDYYVISCFSLCALTLCADLQ